MSSAASTDDIKEAIREIKKKFPDNPIHGIGTSFGAGLLGRVIKSLKLSISLMKEKRLD